MSKKHDTEVVPGKVYPPGTHPHSLAALTMKLGDDEESKQRAREMQAKGAETKRRNRAMREALQLSAKEFKKFKEEVLDAGDGIGALDMLKMQMQKAFLEGDNDTAVAIATTLAEFETPKLSRVESKVEQVDASEMSDEELNAKLAKYADNVVDIKKKSGTNDD